MAKTTARSKRSPKKNTKTVASKASQEPIIGEVYLKKLRKFFSNKKNMINTLIILIVFALLYLFKSVFLVALVNGKPIYRWTIVSQLEEQGGKQVLDSLVTEALVKQAVKDANIQVEKTEIDASIAKIEDRLAAQGLTLEQALEQEGISRAQLAEDLELQLAVDQLLADQVDVTEEEIDQYITNNSEFLPEDLTGDALRAEVKAQLNGSEMNNAVQTWIQDLQEQAQIIYLKNYGGLTF